jgi:predicted nuclease of predicted toxin-antitoxin system
MKLLLDQNISYKLVKRLADVYPGSKHVRQVGLGEADDLAVWDYARENDFII